MRRKRTLEVRIDLNGGYLERLFGAVDGSVIPVSDYDFVQVDVSVVPESTAGVGLGWRCKDLIANLTRNSAPPKVSTCR